MHADPWRPAPDAPTDDAGLAKGAAIGRYVVLGLLGRGGMGEVYAAYDPELDRKIAVKLLRARGGSAEASADGRTRLLREAQAIARLSHPNVVVVYDVGTFGDSVFIAMEFVEGNTLGYWLQAATHRWREVLDVYLAAGRGLVAAHAAGLVHRDFKPDNVMLTKTGQVRVMDFGLAREQGVDEPSPAGQQALEAAARATAFADTMNADMDPDATAKLGGGGGGDPNAEVPSSSGRYLGIKLTQTGAILGTPAYMAPEQFAGTSGDARTDQFSFCVALYEGLYVRRPFAGDNALALMANVVAGTITDPPADARVPTWIRKILLRGLSTSPSARFPSMTELLAALSHDPAVRRRRWLAAATGVAFVAVGAAGAHRFTAGQHAMCAGGPSRAATAWGPERRRAIERAFSASGNNRAVQAFAGAASLFDQYVARWTGMYSEACEATQVRGEQSAEVLDLRMGCLNERLSNVRALGNIFMTADISVVDNAVSAAGALPTLDRCADVAMLRAVIKPPDDPATRARVAALREEVANVNALGTAGQCERAVEAGTKVVATAAALGYLPLEAEAHLALGRLGETCTETTRAIEQLEQATFSAEASRHDQVLIEANMYLGGFYSGRFHDTRAARNALRHGEAVLQRFPGHPILEAWLADGEADVSFEEGRYEEALRGSQKVLALKESVLGQSHFDVAVSASNVALKLHALGRDVEAEPLMARAVDFFTRLFGKDSTRVAMNLVNHAEILMGLGRLAEARRSMETALSTFKKQSASQFYVGYGLLDLGKLEMAEQNPHTAVATLEESVALLGEQDPRITAEARFALARALWISSPRDRRRSVALARNARQTIEKEPGLVRLSHEIEAWQQDHPPH